MNIFSDSTVPTSGTTQNAAKKTVNLRGNFSPDCGMLLLVQQKSESRKNR